MGLIRAPRLLVALTLKQHRFEIATHLGIVSVLAVSVAGLAVAFASLGLDRCAVPSDACRAAEASWSGLRVPSTILAYAVAALPVLTGGIVGASLVASELEQQTAFMPWTIGRSRRRWLIDRGAVLAVFVVAPLLLLGLASDVLQQTTFPTVPVGQSLADYELRGWLVPSRGAIGLVAGILAGIAAGRAIPSLLLAIAIAAIVIALTVSVGRALSMTDITEVSDPGAIITDFKYRDQNNNLLTFEDATAQVAVDDPTFSKRFTLVDFGISGTRSSLIVGTEVVLGAIACAGLLSASAWLVDRRRPS